MDVFDVARVPHEGERDQVAAHPQGEAEVLDVLLGQGRDVDRRTRQVDPLVVGDHPALDDDGVDAGAVHGDDLQLDVAVVDQDRVALGDVAGQTLVGRAADRLVTGDVFGGDDELVPADQFDGTLGELREADLRALEVGEHADRPAGLGGGLADPVVTTLVLRVGTVTEVESGHAHAGLDQSDELLMGVDGGTEGADDFGTAHEADPIGLFRCGIFRLVEDTKGRGGAQLSTSAKVWPAISSSSSVGTTATATRA